ncbi:MAG: hypothetical protein EZS28_042526, partial [Streblomastix strix]
KREEELRENIKEQIHPDQAKWFNPTFIIPNPHQKWRKILDASSLNKEIQTIHFKMNGTDQVRDLISKGDLATSLDLKSAFRHIIVLSTIQTITSIRSNGESLLIQGNAVLNIALPIFFAQALALVLTKIRRESDIRILNYVDDLLLQSQNKERLREQNQTIMRIQEAFGGLQPKINGKQNQNNRLSSNDGQTEFSKSPSKRNILLLHNKGLSKNESVEKYRTERKYDSTQRNPSRTLLLAESGSEELRYDFKSENSRGSNRIRRIPKGLGSDLELQTGDTLVQLVEWNREHKHQTRNKKEMETIYLGPLRSGQIFKELLIKAILINSDSSTSVQDLAKQRVGQILEAEMKKIVKLCHQLRMQTHTQHIPGEQNNIADALSSLSTQGDYSVKKEIFKALCQVWQIIPTLDLFATGKNKLVNRFVAIGEEETEWLNQFSRPWKEEIFWIHPPIPKIGKALINWEKSKPIDYLQMLGLEFEKKVFKDYRPKKTRFTPPSKEMSKLN